MQRAVDSDDRRGACSVSVRQYGVGGEVVPDNHLNQAREVADEMGGGLEVEQWRGGDPASESDRG